MSRYQEMWNDLNIEAYMLSPLAGLYALGWIAYDGMYKLGLKRPAHPHSPIVCVGNLLVGGSGKTPMTLYLARVLREMGREVVVGVSGYGSPRSESASVAPEGPLNALEWGDEGAMLRWRVPDLNLIVGRDRVRAAELCHERFPNAVLLMDDGFQHLRLRKDLSILMTPKVRNGLCLPAGPYREPRGLGMRKADLCLPGEFAPASRPMQLLNPDGSDSEMGLEGATVQVLCAVARPYRFLYAIEQAGANVSMARSLPDHDSLAKGTLLDDFDSAVPLVVTAKDWVKLRARSDLDGRAIVIAWYELYVEPEEGFRNWLRDRLDEIEASRVAQ